MKTMVGCMNVILSSSTLPVKVRNAPILFFSVHKHHLFCQFTPSRRTFQNGSQVTRLLVPQLVQKEPRFWCWCRILHNEKIEPERS